jgi:hypothetical protein
MNIRLRKCRNWSELRLLELYFTCAKQYRSENPNKSKRHAEGLAISVQLFAAFQSTFAECEEWRLTQRIDEAKLPGQV